MLAQLKYHKKFYVDNILVGEPHHQRGFFNDLYSISLNFNDTEFGGLETIAQCT